MLPLTVNHCIPVPFHSTTDIHLHTLSIHFKDLFLCCRFPQQEDRAHQWAVKMRRVDSTTGRLWQLGPGAVLCSLHFLPDDYKIQWGRKLLKPDAVPTVFSFAPPTARRKLPAARTTVGAEATPTLNAVAESDSASSSCLQQSPVPSIAADHTYVVGSPTKLRRQNAQLLLKLQSKTAALRNARRREAR